MGGRKHWVLRIGASIAVVSLVVVIAGVGFTADGHDAAATRRTGSEPSSEGYAPPATLPRVVDDPAPPPLPRALTPVAAASPGGATAPVATSGGGARPPGDEAGPPAPDLWAEYERETRRIVELGAEGLATQARAVIDAISLGDVAAIGDAIAPDEGPGDDYARYLATRYPEALDAAIGPNVNVYAQGEATIYVAYVIVHWSDGGLLSEHTVAIPLRYVDGAWYVTSLWDAGGETTFVQAVRL